MSSGTAPIFPAAPTSSPAMPLPAARPEMRSALKRVTLSPSPSRTSAPESDQRSVARSMAAGPPAIRSGESPLVPESAKRGTRIAPRSPPGPALSSGAPARLHRSIALLASRKPPTSIRSAPTRWHPPSSANAPVGATVPASGTRSRSTRPPASGPDSNAVVAKRNAPPGLPEKRTGSSAKRPPSAS